MSPRRPNGDLTPRERAIRELALNRQPAKVAEDLGVPAADVEALARTLGWPRTVRNLKSAAAAIDEGDGLWQGDIPAAGVRDESETPWDLDSVGDRQDIREHEVEIRETRVAELDKVLGETAQRVADRAGVVREMALDLAGQPVLQVPPGTPEVTAVAAPHDRATLRIPLGRLVDADGAETVLGWAAVDVEVAQEWLLPVLDNPMDDVGNVVRVTGVRREWTPEGVAAVRQLHAALPPEDGDR